MSEEDALLAAIYANHDEDTPLLMYADWLDEHGRHEEAELIRLPSELARLEYYSWPWVHMRDRGTAIESKFRDQWLPHLDEEGKKHVRLYFDRGLLERLWIEKGTPDDVSGLRLLPGVREVSISDSALIEDAVRDIATFKQLDKLSIWRTPFQPQWLDLLDSLPPWTLVEIGERGESAAFDQAWEAFQQRRIAGLANAPTERLRQMFRRRLGNDRYPHGEVPPPGPIRRGGLAGHEDFDLVALSRIQELEELRLSCGSESEEGLRHLTRLPNLRSVEFRDPRVNPIAILAGCTQLERFKWTTEDGLLTDDGTQGLERLTNLRYLFLDGGPGALRDGVFRRLTRLKQLQTLEIHFGELKEDSLGVLAGLPKLEILKLDGPTYDEDVRHLAGQTNLTCLVLTESCVTDAALSHLTRLTKLRTLFVRGEQSQITETAARQLAAQLPHVTILLDHGVIKSPVQAITFQRREVSPIASVLCPATWGQIDHRQGYKGVWLQEEGWEHIDSHYDDDREATLICDALGFASGKSAKDDVEEYAKQDFHADPQILERDVAAIASPDAASCVFRTNQRQELYCKANCADDCVTLIGRVTATRFEEFRALFLYIARSLRVGTDALEGVGEEVTVSVSQL